MNDDRDEMIGLSCIRLCFFLPIFSVDLLLIVIMKAIYGLTSFVMNSLAKYVKDFEWLVGL